MPISTSKSSTLNANASDGGILTFGGGIAPVTITKGGGPDWRTILLIGSGLVAGLIGLWLILGRR